MAFSKLSALVALIAVSAAPLVSASSHMILSGDMIVHERVDPIVTPHGVRDNKLTTLPDYLNDSIVQL